MPATSATHAIFFIVSVLVAAAVAGVMYVVVMDFSESFEEKSNRLVEDMETDIKIANDERLVPYNNSTLSVYVMNTGRRALNPEELLVFVDGSYRNITAISFFNNNTQWLPGTTVNLSVFVENLSRERDHTLKVVLKNGNEDNIIFRIKSPPSGPKREITIINDPEAVPYKDNKTLTIYVKNTGDLVIDINSTSILINGTLRSITNATLQNNETDWNPGVVAVFKVVAENLSKNETHRMKIVVEGGVSATMSFKVKDE